MEIEVVITKRFRANALKVHQYLLKKFDAKTATDFLNRLEKRLDFIASNPEAGRASAKEKNVRSVLLTPHNQIFYRHRKTRIEILCLFDTRHNPEKKPY